MNLRILVCYLLIAVYSIAYSHQLKGIDIKEQSRHLLLFFSLNGRVAPKIFTLSHPDRLVIDFSHTNLDFKLNTNSLRRSMIKNIRSGHPKTGILRLVFELNEPIDFKTTNWQPRDRQLSGFQIELTGKNKAVQNKKTLVSTRHSGKKLRDVVVVIDAGHGGKDPGATGPHGSKEKDVVLAIALRLKKLIDQQHGMRAVLTRNGDYYIGLRQRLNITRKYDADIFVAVHADAFINRQSNGASVFALSQRGATSEAARWLAEKENYSELGGVDLSDLDDQNGMVRSVLIDLSQTATIGASLQMGARVLKQLDKITRLHNDNVEQARFVVLKSPDIPSILIETGFISNPREEKNLTNPAYQQQLSQAIFRGIKQYFEDYPPYGTYVEAMSEGKTHVVQAGETLSGIAEHYKISLSSLCSANKLSKTAPLKIGQKLIIPSSWA
ncbi:N-acetylmuramoyl-L-alanine amidase [Legionella israelensis]|uniref:N-acetylmuramoyl-L-alanine amidase AmiC n=1 Tax=Legionella israelensis TaxID=454 RepID=A0A0W0V450_9GAMM|nr:N-acetylmuramoyl-L-alanine amidase [Legionella israelensis]KTD14457.1 N-acetylmuramoyl-L-alanine amidase [Legionella israelensis]QBS09330.1 AMIN domain-containing protein [Legionella israelensis]SCX89981.1 N-acetylmuramoyl-L-alanine amidase [Legionella israelensis DSM 19235]STX60228.1 N-acetylmuramoyl-L-alanine amidase [Legionella israelensis]